MDSNEVKVEEKKKKFNILKKIKKAFKKIGPGFITGAADDDPSGIATYSITGAQYGYRMNFLVLFLMPSMIVIQEMCGRLGMITGKGLADIIEKYCSRKILYFTVLLLVIANVINIGADLGIIAASIQMILGFKFYYWLGLSAIFIILMEITIPYEKYSKILKWLGLSLGVYVITAFLVKQDWSKIAFYTFIPHIELNSEYIMTIIGFIGTTISPYLFFWQTSDEVEEAILEDKIDDFGEKIKVRTPDIRKMSFDTRVGMIFSNLIAFFIILTTAATLHISGITHIETAQQAALALRPLAGNFAYLLFAIGIIGIGLESIPVLAGSVGYAVAELFDLKEGLSKPFSKAKGFYVIIAISTVIGVAINYFQINIIQALFYSAVINGIASIPLIALIIKLSSDEKIVGRFKTKLISRIIAYITLIFIILSAMFMIYSLFFK